MRINFYPIRQFQLEALGAAGPIGVGIGAAQTAVGLVQAISQGARAKRLMKRRRAYQTPEEIFKIQQAMTSRASGGYDPGTLDYLTGQNDRAFSSSLSAATRLGADPNQLSELLDRRIQSTFRIGAENQLQNMKNFQGYIDALGLVAENKAAEQKSQQDLLKDELQAASAGQQAGFQNILGGAQTALNTLSAAKIASLYGQPGEYTNTLTKPGAEKTVTLPERSLPGISGSTIPDVYLPVEGGTQRFGLPGIVPNSRYSQTTAPLSVEQILDLLNKVKIGQ